MRSTENQIQKTRQQKSGTSFTGRKLQQNVVVSNSFSSRYQASLSPPPFEPQNHLFPLKGNTNKSFEPPSPLYPSTTTNAKVPELVVNSKFKFNSNNVERLPTLLFQQNKKTSSCNIREQPLEPSDNGKLDVFMVPYAPKNQSAIRVGYQPLKSGGNAKRLPHRREQDLTTAATTAIARMSIDRISGRKLDESSQGPIIHISDSFNSPQNITNGRKQITYSPIHKPNTNQNQSLNLEMSNPVNEHRSEFIALQKKIAAQICASSDFQKNIQPTSLKNRSLPSRSQFQQQRSNSALSRSIQFQPKQPALQNIAKSKRLISQQRKTTDQQNNAESIQNFNTAVTRRSKSVMRNKQPKQLEKSKRYNRNAVTPVESSQANRITPHSTKYALNMSQDIEARAIIKPISLQNTTTLNKKTVTTSENLRYQYKKQSSQQQHYPSFGTIPQSMINRNILSDMIMTPSNDMIQRSNKTPTLTKKDNLTKLKATQPGVVSFGVTGTTSSNKRDSRIDKLIRANLKHKKELQQLEKVKHLEQVKAQLDLKQKLY